MRREFPSGLPGEPENSVYTYLAPAGVGDLHGDREGAVLSFAAPSFSIFPNDEDPYGRQAEYGTAIKLYDYRFIGDRSHILRSKSLRSRIDLLLPEIGLPVRFYEYRKDKRGNYLDVGSRRTTVSGLLRRIKDSQNVVEGFPIQIPLQPEGEKLIANIFAFVPEGTSKENEEAEAGTSKRLGGVKSYRKNEGIVFVRNGQTQWSLPKSFFGRDPVKMKPLADDLLVFVDCDQLSPVVRENLFMTSRDRSKDNAFRKALISSLENTLRECQELKDLRNQRQQERMSARLEDDKPLSDVLESLIKNSPNLTTLLKLGQRISAPFKTQDAGSDKEVEFKGEVYPTFFKNKGEEYGKPLQKNCEIDRRLRLTFETNARNDYFTRPAERGELDLRWRGKDGVEYKTNSNGPNLKNGIATLTVDLPEESGVGDTIEFIARTRDSQRLFENRIFATIRKKSEHAGGGNGVRKPPKNHGKDRERPTELESPKITPVYRAEWEDEGFDDFTAMKIEPIGYSEDEEAELYEFKINMDNVPLESEAKQKRLGEEQVKLLRQQFMYANVLVGLSILLEDKQRKASSDSQDIEESVETIEERVERTCRALAPFIPALITLGTDDFELNSEIEGLEETG